MAAQLCDVFGFSAGRPFRWHGSASAKKNTILHSLFWAGQGGSGELGEGKDPGLPVGAHQRTDHLGILGWDSCQPRGCYCTVRAWRRTNVFPQSSSDWRIQLQIITQATYQDSFYILARAGYLDFGIWHRWVIS